MTSSQETKRRGGSVFKTKLLNLLTSCSTFTRVDDDFTGDRDQECSFSKRDSWPPGLLFKSPAFVIGLAFTVVTRAVAAGSPPDYGPFVPGLELARPGWRRARWLGAVLARPNHTAATLADDEKTRIWNLQQQHDAMFREASNP